MYHCEAAYSMNLAYIERIFNGESYERFWSEMWTLICSLFIRFFAKMKMRERKSHQPKQNYLYDFICDGFWFGKKF